MVVKPNVVYILVCLNEKYLGRVYIGYTVDPVRRLKQHNLGKEFGGAFKTSKKGPWDMVLFLSGFPNEISALRFEWTLQHPTKSRRLTGVRKKKRAESILEYHLHLLESMLNMGPWNRLPLSLHWLHDRKLFKEFSLPEHISIIDGTSSVTTADTRQLIYEDDCLFCVKEVEEKDRIVCLNADCSMTSHFVCLARYMLGDSYHVIPLSKHCPLCDTDLSWGNIVQIRTDSFNE